MSKPLTLLTGHSRGLGAALAAQCLRKGHVVLGISRQPHPGLPALAERYGGELYQWTHDLAEPEQAAWPMLDWLQSAGAARFSSATLINNAGVIAPLRDLAALEPADTARALRVGLEAAMVLTGVFLRGTVDWLVPRKVMNISSGLGRRAMAGSASYCAAKAGMDHFSRAVALEEAAHPNGARIVSIAPGVIDTDMQVQLRSADPRAFADQSGFARLHQDGQLASAEDTARKLLAWLDRPDYGAEPVADVRKP
ncbi:SDR family NAD(P)-dependent oxidoreductase [Ideonella livida]|uniref:SDR family NAD(P)-dependent oxidoreductase n=1 Tax=Ideonella livida TaxID=2707176 RepID=A0A7C9TKE2_9BURK|nr:SDR family NAD(P)-dependent oxidoreductase [Ideonella livida]NDY91684.1 SDR family NAD(P)-dependent oxidoreductase [Ideonella livida]